MKTFSAIDVNMGLNMLDERSVLVTCVKSGENFIRRLRDFLYSIPSDFSNIKINKPHGLLN